MMTVTVLLVEDNDVDVEAVRRSFRRNRVTNPVEVARDGVEALEVLRSGTLDPPVMALLDLNMPRMNGIEFLMEVRADPALRRLVVFVLTTSDADEDRLAAYDLNVAGYIVKGDVGRDQLGVTRLLDAYWKAVRLP